MRVCLVTTFFPPENFGGDGVHVERLAAALARRGHAVTVVHAPGAYRMLARGVATEGVGSRVAAGDGEGIEVRAPQSLVGRLEPYFVHQTGVPVLSRGFLRRTLSGGDDGPFDVIHYHNVSLVGGVGVFAFGQGVKLYTAHEYWLGCPTHLLFRYNREICARRTCVRCTLHSRRPPQWWRYLGRRDRYLNHLDAMIFPSVLTQSVYRDLAIARHGVVIPHFVPDAYRRAAAALSPRSTGTEPYCLYVGRLAAVKGLQNVLPAFARGDLPMPLWIVGEGPQGAMLRSRFGSAEKIRFLGPLDGSRLGRLYRDAAAVILPSASLETFGQVIIEAFAHATPAIASRTGAGRELIEASGAGSTYETIDELRAALAALTHPGQRGELGRRALRHVDTAHTESAYVQRYEALVEEHRR